MSSFTEAAMDKRIKKHAAAAYDKCKEVPLNTCAHRFRHAKASHWIEDGLSIVEVQLKLGFLQVWGFRCSGTSEDTLRVFSPYLATNFSTLSMDIGERTPFLSI